MEFGVILANLSFLHQSQIGIEPKATFRLRAEQRKRSCLLVFTCLCSLAFSSSRPLLTWPVFLLKGPSADLRWDGVRYSLVMTCYIVRCYMNSSGQVPSCTQPSQTLADGMSGNKCSHLRRVGRRQGPGPTSNSAVTEWVCGSLLHISLGFLQGWISDLSQSLFFGSDIVGCKNTGDPVINAEVSSINNLLVRIIHSGPTSAPKWAGSERNLSLPTLPLLSTRARH